MKWELRELAINLWRQEPNGKTKTQKTNKIDAMKYYIKWKKRVKQIWNWRSHPWSSSSASKWVSIKFGQMANDYPMMLNSREKERKTNFNGLGNCLTHNKKEEEEEESIQVS